VTCTRSTTSPYRIFLALALAASTPAAAAQGPAAAPPKPQSPAASAPASAPAGAKAAAADKDREVSPNRLVRDGLSIEFSLEKAMGDPKQPLLEGDFAEARFRMTDATTGRPVPGLKPAVWLDIAGVVGGRAGSSRECKDKVALYLQGSVGIRPLVDLNSYYLLVLNQDASISVIDPVVSMTGNTSLFASIALKRPGSDWTRTADEKRLFVSMPKAGQVAVIDSERFAVVRNVEAGKLPVRLALQRDGRYLWAGDDSDEAGSSGVTVIDTEKLAPAAFVATGRGHHEIAFSNGDRHAFVTNRGDGTVSVVDVGTLRKVKDLRTGPLPIAIATSPLSGAIYVADGKAGTVAVVDPDRLEVRARIKLAPGLGPMRFTQDGRYAFVVNPAERAVFVVDSAGGELVHRIDMGGQPYQVTFTRAFAHVRLLDSEHVKMVNLLSIGKGKKPIVQSYAAGQGAPRSAGEIGIADAISPAATDAAVFVVNPADNTTSFYMEGMNAPMGSYAGYGHAIRAVSVVDRSLRELEPGVYGAKLRVPVAGHYDVAFLLDNPRILHCFSADANPNPALRQNLGALSLQFLPIPADVAAGTTLPLRVKLVDPATNQPRTGLKDVQVLYHRLPNGPRNQAIATEKGDGVYEAPLGLGEGGTYYAFVAVPSLDVKPNQLPFRGFVVRDAPRPLTRKASR
jgi:YVTN family beta-propeller protein